MEKTLKIINEMQRDGIFKKYAVAGGIAAIFYIEPITTFDLDIFVILDEDKAKIISLDPIYQWIDRRGYEVQNEQIIIEGIPVQFIPVYNPLINKAVENASEIKYKNIVVYVTGTNLLTLTKYSGYNPEFMFLSNPYYMGVDYGKIPFSRSFIIGIKLDL